MKQEKTNKEKKTNVWKVATIFLGLVLIFIIVYLSVKEYQEPNNWKDNICSKITATPSWTDSNGNILQIGAIPLLSLNTTTNEIIYLTTKEYLKEMLIDSNIIFIYSSTCSACESQINQFKMYNFWEEYKDSGLTIDCVK